MIIDTTKILENITWIIKGILIFLIIFIIILCIYDKPTCICTKIYKSAIQQDPLIEKRLRLSKIQQNLLMESNLIIQTSLNYDSIRSIKKLIPGKFIHDFTAHKCYDSICFYFSSKNQIKLPQDSIIYSKLKIKNGYDRNSNQNNLKNKLDSQYLIYNNLDIGVYWFVSNVIQAKTKDEFRTLAEAYKERLRINEIEHENIIKEKNWISTFYIFCLIGIGCMIILLFKLLHKSKFIKNHESLDFNSIPKHSIHSNLRYKIKQNIVGDIGTSQEIEAIKPTDDPPINHNTERFMDPVLYDMEYHSIKHRYVGHFALYFLIIMLIFVTYFINFDFIPNQGKQILDSLNTENSSYPIVTYYIGRSIIFGSFFSGGLNLSYKIAKGIYDQSIRYRKECIA
ncbi:MAG: hypothetical protein IPL31_04395 [Saprospiraceae bacterium]|nr:hypothetical protein [Saprospiraceae bacterium]